MIKFLHRKFKLFFFPRDLSELTSHNKPQGSTMHLQLQQKCEFAFLTAELQRKQKVRPVDSSWFWLAGKRLEQISVRVEQFSPEEPSSFSLLVPTSHFLWFWSILTSPNGKANWCADKKVKLTRVTFHGGEHPVPFSLLQQFHYTNKEFSWCFPTHNVQTRGILAWTPPLSHKRLSSVNEICMRKHL